LQQPETNGIAKRFIRTMNEQVIYGVTYRGVEDLRDALTDFKERYNCHWRVENNGYRTPYEMRQVNELPEAA